MLGILAECKNIVASGDQTAKEEIKGVLKKITIFSYSEDGELMVKQS
jgi:hypothetical protein